MVEKPPKFEKHIYFEFCTMIKLGNMVFKLNKFKLYLYLINVTPIGYSIMYQNFYQFIFSSHIITSFLWYTYLYIYSN